MKRKDTSISGNTRRLVADTGLKNIFRREDDYMTQTLRSILDEAWRHRRAQDLPACMDLLSELKAELTLPYARLKSDAITTILKPKVIAQPVEQLPCTLETLILWASLLRAQKDMSAAEDLLTFVEAFIGLVPHADRRSLVVKLSQEQGLNAYARGEFSSALEHFAVQGRLGASPVDRAMGQVNGLLCYESLGLPTNSIHQRARDSVHEVKTSGPNLANELENVVIDFERRQAFFRGDLKTVFDSDLRDTHYSSYMRAWMGNLPWHMRYLHGEALTKLIAAMIPDAGALHLQDFRLRTLQGVSLPQDPLQMPASEIAIRAYLWTWRWLLNPEVFDVQRILDTLASPVLLERPNSIAPGHAHMLRNAALWIGLFCASHSARFERWSKALPLGTGDGLLVFTWENLLIRLIEARHHHRARVISDIKAVTASIPSGRESGVLFLDLIAAQDSADEAASLRARAPWLALFMQNLGAKFSISSPAPGSSNNQIAGEARASQETKVVIDLLTHEVKKDNLAQISRGMALGFAVLKSQGQVSRSDFVATVWGIHNYEPGIHDVKILNLLARMRALVAGDLRLGVKDHLVFASGDWDAIEIIGSLSHVKDLSQAKVSLRSGARRADAGSFEVSALRRAKAMLEVYVTENNSTKLTRRDIEDILNLPRSSASRMIERLTKQQILTPMGHGPRRHYEFKTKWETSL